MKNKRDISYPYVLYSQLGYRAVISCLEAGHFRFFVTTPKNYPEFDWFSSEFDNINESIMTDEIQKDLVESFLDVAIKKGLEV